MKVKEPSICNGQKQIIPVGTGQRGKHELCCGLWMRGQWKVIPCGAHMRKGTSWMPNSASGSLSPVLCLYSTKLRTREACNGTDTGMNEVYLSVHGCSCVCVCGRLFDKWPDHLFKPISSNPCSEVKIQCKFVPALVYFNIRGSLISKSWGRNK